MDDPKTALTDTLTFTRLYHAAKMTMPISFVAHEFGQVNKGQENVATEEFSNISVYRSICL